MWQQARHTYHAIERMSIRWPLIIFVAILLIMVVLGYIGFDRWQ